MQVHFISGMPRSGSTLLAGLLSQNPAIHASFQSPVAQVVTRTISEMSHKDNEGGCFYTSESRLRTLRAIISAYYAEIADHKKVIFDSSRRWCAHMALVSAMFPGSKVIACVREVRSIIDSFERLFQKNPAEISRVIGRPNSTVYDRVHIMLEHDAVVGYSLNAFAEAFYGPYQRNLLVVDYADLAQRPLLVLNDIHAALELDPYDYYDINHVETPPGAEEFDRNIGLPGLHALRPKILYEPRNSLLPPDIFAALPEPFWKADVRKNSVVKSIR
jgi:sulfotransferase